VICADCQVRNRAVCAALEPQALHELGEIASTSAFTAGQLLFSEGEAAEAVFNITRGAVKTYKLLADGRRQITGFLFPGDLLGMDQLGAYVNSAEALGEVRACRYLRRRFDALAERFPRLEKRLLSTMLDEMAETQEQLLLLGRKTAPERLASFLLRLSVRQLKRGVAAQPVRLAMTRADIADFLGLTTETVSRTLTRFRTQALIRLLPDHQVELTDELRLAALAGGSP
jgi:CRP/FNR family transcriptional regulator